MNRRLTRKQRAFISWYVSSDVNCNATEAARRAGYKGNDATLANVAAENLRKPYIRDEIDKRIKQALSGADITIEKVLRDLETTRVRAMEMNQLGAAVRCSELHGKYLKLFTDRIEQVKGIEEVTNAELLAEIREMAKELKIDPEPIIKGFIGHDPVSFGDEGTGKTH